FWNPYSCGGHSSWGGPESGSALVSLWLPLYLIFKVGIAVRLEVVGMGLVAVIGMWLLATRFTKSAGVRLLACAVFALNTRWAMQAAVGHTWHLSYGYLPWVLYFY